MDYIVLERRQGEGIEATDWSPVAIITEAADVEEAIKRASRGVLVGVFRAAEWDIANEAEVLVGEPVVVLNTSEKPIGS